jgi:hypothetical protein
VTVTELLLATGERVVVDGTPQEVEATILAAARGSLMQLAWLTDVGTGVAVGINPPHVVALRPRAGA